MQNLGEKKQYQIWNKANILFEEFLTEESFLNYPISELFDDLATRLEKKKRYLEKYWKSLEDCNWQEKMEELEEFALEEYAKEPFSKITVLVAANILIFIWMAGNGIFGSVIPNQLGVYITSALGAEADEINMEAGEAGFSQGLGAQNNNILELKANPENDSISEIKCDSDKRKNRSSNLCPDFDAEQDLISQMREEEIRMHEKENAKNAFSGKKTPVVVKRGPIPYVFAIKDGRRVCNRKNDHPSKSKQNKKGHMDMECCLDPDETPNPNCYYSLEKYGKYL